MKKQLFIGITLAIISFSLIWLILTPVLFPVSRIDASISAPQRGFTAPGFSLQTPQESNHSLSDYEGQPVLVFFWASWCSVCKAAMPGLQAVYTDYAPNGFTILAINTSHQDTLATALNYFQSQGYSYTMLLDLDGAVSQEYQVRALPTSVLIGGDGVVADVVIGSGVSEGYLRARLDQILITMEED